jgi:hypothetical protein
MHRYTVELRIVGENFDPDEVTRELGLMPTRMARKGQAKVEGAASKWTANMWGFEVLPSGGDGWSSLEDGVASLLHVFSSLHDRLHVYSMSNKICVWCGHFTSSFDGGPTLSPTLLRSLGSFGVPLVLDTYCERTTEDTEPSEGLLARG